MMSICFVGNYVLKMFCTMISIIVLDYTFFNHISLTKLIVNYFIKIVVGMAYINGVNFIFVLLIEFIFKLIFNTKNL